MRKVLAWPLAHALYGIGHGCSLLMEKMPGADSIEPGRLFCSFFNAYQWTMQRSFRLSEWANLGLWRHPDASTTPPKLPSHD